MIFDMNAGIEHLGRGTAENVNVTLSVVEPRVLAIETAERIRRLASDIGVGEVIAVGNKISNEEELELIYGTLREISSYITRSRLIRSSIGGCVA